MKILLIGPNPPPHGGISVHVSGIHKQLVSAGITCQILDTSRVRPGLRFALMLLRNALDGWTLHFHTNGHNVKSWLLAFGCGLAGQFGVGSLLTLHSGMLPGYVESAPWWSRKLAALTCSLYTRVICVSPEIERALLSLNLDPGRREVLPAFLKAGKPGAAVAPALRCWISRRWPLFSTVLFFRPEYGFDVLVASLARLRSSYPAFGCLVMGSGEQRAEAKKSIRDAGLDENILLLGDVNHESCIELIAASDVFVRATMEDGDSISVREALSLGIPVVASRVGMRPAGAILFRPGNVDEMVAMIELAMAAPRGCQTTGGDLAAGTSMDRLLEIYRQVGDSEGSLCLN